MSREDPQLRIRLPFELKEKIENAARENSRSMNAEIVHRLDSTLLKSMPNDELVSAQDAIRIATKAKEELSETIFTRTFSEINKKIRIGHTTFCIELDDLDLEGIEEKDFEGIFQLTFKRLKELGYTVPDSSWDVGGFIVEIPR
ncbi:Arc family DNA-binding protein [Rouxiella sp. Mn2063]|uniref:Arc family DNA-binding protein n=1 Tax=Rouxiella sp. Mn2063 TaxID=3395262 RepID=UPI003BD4995C